MNLLTYLQLMRLLRRLGLVNEQAHILNNYKLLRKRQSDQLSLLEPLKNNIKPALLNCNIQELLKEKGEQVFNTFTTRCLKTEIRSLNALADVNIQNVLEKRGHDKIPFTVKDHLKVEGLIETCGFGDNLKPSTTTSDVVTLLEREGCVPFAHTNIPQGLIGIESTNPLYGTSYNPHNTKFISGGSSGGQGALVASKACAFGLGSDSGGSARIPAAFCGIFGFKPTGSKRLSLKGRVGPSGAEGIKVGDLDPCMGFLTRHFDDIVWLCSKTLGKTPKQEGQHLYGGEWNQSRYQAAKRKKLKVGYLYDCDEMKVAPGIKNTIQQTLQLLRNNKHKVVQFKFQKLTAFRDFFFKFVHNTGFLNALYQRMDGHSIANQAQPFYDIKLFGDLGLKFKLGKIQDEKIRQIFSIYLKDQSTAEFLKMHKEMSEHRNAFLKKWKQQQIDVLITPVMPFTAPLPGTSELLVYQLTYCCFQNVMQLPAGVIPTRLVNENQLIYDPLTPFERVIAPAIRQSEGLPLSIQVTGSHLEDEECLGAMWQIQRLNGKYLQPKL